MLVDRKLNHSTLLPHVAKETWTGHCWLMLHLSFLMDPVCMTSFNISAFLQISFKTLFMMKYVYVHLYINTHTNTHVYVYIQKLLYYSNISETRSLPTLQTNCVMMGFVYATITIWTMKFHSWYVWLVLWWIFTVFKILLLRIRALMGTSRGHLLYSTSLRQSYFQ